MNKVRNGLLNPFIFKYVVLFFFFFCLGINIYGAKKVENGYILVINSYTENSDWSDDFIQPLYRTLLENKSLRVYTEQMNMLAITDEKQVEDYWVGLHTNYSKEKPLLILMLGNSAWGLLKDDIRQVWPEVPVLLCAELDYMNSREAYLKKYEVPESEKRFFSNEPEPYLNVVYVPYYIKETVALMDKLLPDMKELLFLSDQRYINVQNRGVMRELAAQYPQFQVKFLTAQEISNDSLISIIQHVDKTTGILFSSWYHKSTQQGNIILTSTISKVLDNYAASPIFSLSNILKNNKGALGGFYEDNEQIYHELLKIVDEVLDGDFSGQFKLITSVNQPLPYINYPVSQEFGLPESLYPKDTIFLSKPPTLWQQYKYTLLSLIILLVCLIFFVSKWMYWMYSSKKQQKHQLELMQDYNSLFRNMPIVYLRQQLIFDDTGELQDCIITDVNPAFEKHFGSREKVIGRHIHNTEMIIQSEHLKLYKLAVKEKREILFQTYYTPNERSYSVIIVPSERKGYVEVFCVDDTELTKTQQLLRLTNHKLSMALNIASVVPWKWDLENGTILCDINRPVELADGMDQLKEEQLSVPYYQYFSKISKKDKDRVKEAYQQLINGKVNKIREEYQVLVREKGKMTYEWVEAQAAVDKRNEKGEPLSLIGSSQVITTRKNMELDLLDAKEKAEESNRLKSAFLANMSHEIRTPLNAIVGFSGILAMADKEEERKEYLSIIENNNELLLQLIGDILDLSKIEAGTLEFFYSDVDLNGIFKEIESTIQQRSANGNLEIVYERSMPECYVNIERNRVSQIVLNLLNNALKFTTFGSIHFGYHLKDAETLYFYVKDTGCGIPQDKINQVFERFVKLNTFAQGTGLGLAICQLIIQQMKGDIGVESEVGKGSTFWFTLPYQPAQRIELKEQTPVIQREKIRADQLKVLIAEDNESNFKLFESALKNDFQIIHAWDGEEAVKMFKEHQPHIILMDINMPKMTGYEATQAIRKISVQIPIIAVTAYAYADDEKKIMTSGFDAYVSKPLCVEKLKGQMLRLLQRNLIF